MSKRKTSVMGEIRAANPDLDVPLVWLQHSNVHQAYHPGYINEEDVEGPTFGKVPDRVRQTVSRAIDASLLYYKDRGSIYRARERIDTNTRALNAEKELIYQREAHSTTCMFAMPDMGAIDPELTIHPEMDRTTVCALQQLDEYQSVIRINNMLNNLPIEETWTPSEFEQWFQRHCNLCGIVHREQGNGILRIVYRMDIGWRFFLVWMLPYTGTDRARLYKRGAILFFSCKCKI